MSTKAGRNDPCPCGSGKKYKNCCLNLERPKGASILKRKISAKVLKVPPPAVNLIERTYSQSFQAAEKESGQGETPGETPEKKEELLP